MAVFTACVPVYPEGQTKELASNILCSVFKEPASPSGGADLRLYEARVVLSTPSRNLSRDRPNLGLPRLVPPTARGPDRQLRYHGRGRGRLHNPHARVNTSFAVFRFQASRFQASR